MTREGNRVKLDQDNTRVLIENKKKKKRKRDEKDRRNKKREKNMILLCRLSHYDDLYICSTKIDMASS